MSNVDCRMPNERHAASFGIRQSTFGNETAMSYRILIVDDSSTIRAMIKRTITLAEVPVERFFEAPDGRQALQVLTEEPIDLVVADLNMPEMNGIEMTAEMRQDPKLAAIPVVVVSAEPDVEKLEALKKDNIRGYIRKPCTPEGVKNVISGLLAIPR
jgi:two-component system, chemotaxis family, chemotaxis protein CheY